MKKLMMMAVLSMLLAGCANAPKDNEAGPREAVTAGDTGIRDGVFIHLSHSYDDPARASMAMMLAVKFSDSLDVTVFCDLEAVNMLKKDSEHFTLPDPYMCPKHALGQLLEKGVTVMACPMCLKAKGIDPKDLVEGVIVAEKEKFLDFTKGRILTLDY